MNEQEKSLFAAKLASQNLAALRVCALLVASLVPLFWLLDIVVLPAYAMPLLIARLGCMVFAILLLYVIPRYQEWAKRHVYGLAVSLTLLVGLLISVMCWLHDGYESPYYAGLGLVYMAVGSLYVWRFRLAVFFGLTLYVAYMMPLALGHIPIKEPVTFAGNQFFLASIVLISLMTWVHRYRTERNEFLIARKLERTKTSLEEANHKLQELDTMKSQFFANISHELRTPLTLSLGPIEASLQEAEQLPERVTGFLKTVRSNQLRLAGLINDLLELARLEAGRPASTYRKVQLGPFVNQLIETITGAAAERHLVLNVELPETPVSAFIDREKMETVLMNLLSNAFKFTREGGYITVAVTSTDKEVILSVSDTGVGIPQAKLASVFDRFSQVDPSATREYAGTGIGLALVKEFVELHGGHITVTSSVGEGSTFTTHIPLGHTHLDPARILHTESPAGIAMSSVNQARWQEELAFHEADDKESHATISASDAFESMAEDESIPDTELGEVARKRIEQLTPSMSESTILVVDDTPDMRRYIASLLEPYYRVYTAKDGLEGLAFAEAYRPDLIVSDVMMPKMSGEEMCARIKRSSGRLARTPVLLVTARADEGTKLRALEHGADDYLFKPFHPSELVLRTRNHLRTRTQERSLFRAHRELAAKQSEMDKDLALARTFQQSFLGRSKAPEGFDFGAVYRPLIAVGGDLYDVFDLGDGTCRIFIADVTDHGVQAALRTAVVRSEYERLKHDAETPSELLNCLNDFIIDQHGLEIIFSACCVDLAIGPEGIGDVLFARTGGMPIDILSKLEPRTVEGAFGPLLGMIPAVHFPLGNCKLMPSERLLLYTDGLGLQTSSEGEAYAERALPKLRGSLATASSAQVIVETILQDWQAFVGTQSTQDDLTTIVIGIHKS